MTAARIVALVAVSLTGATAWAGDSPPPDDAAPPARPGVHAEHTARFGGVAPRARLLPPPALRPQPLNGAAERPIVYGYLPYWITDISGLRWSNLTHLAWFAVSIDGTGRITDRNGWPDREIVAAAQAAGVKVDLAVTLFDAAGIRALVTSAANRRNAVSNLIAEMTAGGADGLAIDFEGFPAGVGDDMTLFLRELRAELDRRGLAAAEVSMALPAVDYNRQFDPVQLAAVVDVLFIMGYDYFYRGSSNTGPPGMFRLNSFWRRLSGASAQRSMAEWTRGLTAAQRRRVVHGVPYYGYRWAAASGNAGAATTAAAASVFYNAAMNEIAGGRARRFDEASLTPWYTYATGGTTYQAWFDDAESLRAKYDWIREQGLGGTGMWALGYDAQRPELWNLLAERFFASVPPTPGSRGAPTAVTVDRYTDRRDTRTDGGAFFNWYGCRPDLPEYGREVVYAVAMPRAGRVVARIIEDAGVDVDVHALTGLEESDCVARGDTAIDVRAAAGTLYVVVDTYVADQVPQAGPYSLTIERTLDPGPDVEPEPEPEPEPDDADGTDADTLDRDAAPEADDAADDAPPAGEDERIDEPGADADPAADTQGDAVADAEGPADGDDTLGEAPGDDLDAADGNAPDAPPGGNERADDVLDTDRGTWTPVTTVTTRSGCAGGADAGFGVPAALLVWAVLDRRGRRGRSSGAHPRVSA